MHDYKGQPQEAGQRCAEQEKLIKSCASLPTETPVRTTTPPRLQPADLNTLAACCREGGGGRPGRVDVCVQMCLWALEAAQSWVGRGSVRLAHFNM